MDLNDISAFIEVVKAGSFSQASKRLGIPKSTLSRKVSQLEERLSVQLMSRTTRKMQLTHIGEEYFQKASLLLKEISDLESNAFESQKKPQGHLRFTAPLEAGSLLLAPMLHSFMEKYPEIELEMDFTDRYVNMIEEGYDLALRAGKLEDSSLRAKKIGTECFYVCASPSYLQKNGEPKKPEELSQHRCLSFLPQSRGGAWTLKSEKEKIRVPLKNKINMNTLNMCKALAIQGSGLALLPQFFCHDSLMTGELQRVLPIWSTEENGFYLVYPEQKFIPLRLRLLIDHLSQAFALRK